jgi:tRNA pseudouridine55 synthase
LISGLLVVDKPAGCTSHDVVARCRRIYGQRRIGHSGTLDPDATGVLLVGLGRVTRLLRFLTELSKTYTGEVVLGVETSTLDGAGEVTATFDMAGITDADIGRAAGGFVGQIEQVPPMVSAVKVGGRRLHELAREGIEVARQARPVTIHRLVTGPVAGGVFPIEVECSSGTYVRVLAADIGKALRGGAHLRHLRRTAIGSFDQSQATPVDDLGPEHLLPAAAALRDYRSLVVEGDLADAVAHGRSAPAALLGDDGDAAGPVALVDGAGELLAVYEPGPGGMLKPAVVLTG